MMPVKRSRKTGARPTPDHPPAMASPSTRIDARIAELGGWRGETLARVRALVRAADPGIVEEWKWQVPVWSCEGILCTGEAYRTTVKLTFARGAALADPSRLFNASLTGNTRRAIDLREGDRLNARAFTALVRAAVKLNRGSGGLRTRGKTAAAPPVLLSGGNPQIAKADGDSPVQAYLAAMPGWKRAVGRRLDALIMQALPGVRKAVKWNSPLYGTEKHGWFLGVHCFNRYIKVAFFNGGSLRPPPPVGSKDPATRYLHLHEGEPIDEARFTRWVKQAARRPGWGRVS